MSLFVPHTVSACGACVQVDLVHSIVFCVMHTDFARELCVVDLRIHNASGYIGFRRNYLERIQHSVPLMLGVDGVPEWCNVFTRQEIAVGIGDVLLCALVVLATLYYGGSLLRARLRMGGDAIGSASKYGGRAPYRV
jgi:hypothetical protein